MNSFRPTILWLGITLLTLAATLMIAIGIADAQAPNFVCVGPTMFGCTGQACAAADGTCNNLNWDGQERQSFDFRNCSGAAGTCVGGSTSFKTCENRFYTMDPMNRNDLCFTKGCTLTTTVTACTP